LDDERSEVSDQDGSARVIVEDDDKSTDDSKKTKIVVYLDTDDQRKIKQGFLT